MSETKLYAFTDEQRDFIRDRVLTGGGSKYRLDVLSNLENPAYRNPTPVPTAQELIDRMYALTWEYRGDAYKAMQQVIGEYNLSVPKMEPTQDGLSDAATP